MKLTVVVILLAGAYLVAAEREKRQAEYQFPGPRGDEYGGGQDDRQYRVANRQFQGQPVRQYAPQPAPAPRQAPPPQYDTYSAPAAAPAPRRPSGSRARTKYADDAFEEEEEPKPDPLAILLQDSKFSCSGKSDGYYADNSIKCQAFHYCVGGARHSWMCPEGTVFHQVHLNCVPASQDICGQSEKFHFVNDYLYKPIDYKGPNNTARYAQRYYPEGYSLGDGFAVQGPQQQGSRPSYGGQAQGGYETAPAAAAPRPRPQPAYQAAPQQLPAYPVASQPQPQPQAPPRAPPRQAPVARPALPEYSAPAPAPQYRPLPPPTKPSYEPQSIQTFKAPAPKTPSFPEFPSFPSAPAQPSYRGSAQGGSSPQRSTYSSPAQYRPAPAQQYAQYDSYDGGVKYDDEY